MAWHIFENVQKSKYLLLGIFTSSSFKVDASLSVYGVLVKRYILNGMFEVGGVLRDQF